jgi:hypothetical protein
MRGIDAGLESKKAVEVLHAAARPGLAELLSDTGSGVVTLFPDGQEREELFRMKAKIAKDGSVCEGDAVIHPDRGSALNIMDWGWYGTHREKLGTVMGSEFAIRTADGSVNEAKGKVVADVLIGHEKGMLKSTATFYLIDAGGSWDVLLGRPWLRQVRAVEDHAEGTITFPVKDGEVVVRSAKDGASDRPPLLGSVLHVTEVDHDYGLPPVLVAGVVDRAEEVARQVTVGADLDESQRARVVSLIRRHHEAWALSLSEVEESPIGEHSFEVDPEVKLPMRTRIMRMSKDEERAMSEQVNVLLEAGIIEACDPSQVKCVSEVIMTPKKEVYADGELRELVAAGLDSVEDIGCPADFDDGTADQFVGTAVRRAEPVGFVDCVLTSRPSASGWLGRTMGVFMAERVVEVAAAPERRRSYRMVHNYKPLNRAINIGSYIPGEIQTMVARHAGRRWVCVLDQLGAFFACPLAKECRPYTAFFVPSRGFFMYRRMPQGLQGSPATHQVNTATAFHDLINEFMDVWMDDFFFGGDDFEEMLGRLERLLMRAKEFKVRFSPSKTKLFVSKVVVGGHELSIEGMAPDPGKVAAIRAWPKPKSVIQVMGFLGTCGYFRNRIKSYALISGPLYDLTRDIRFDKGKGKGAYRKKLEESEVAGKWGEAQEQAFETLKRLLSSHPVIHAPDHGLDFHVACDASALGFGGHLYQLRDGRLFTLEFASRRTTQAESKRHSFKLELAACKWAMDRFSKTFRPGRVILHTDCSAVMYLLNNDKSNWMNEDWKQCILGNNVVRVVHTKGTDNKVSDGLSRNPSGESGDEVVAEWDTKGVVQDVFWVDGDGGGELRKRFEGDVLEGVVNYLTKLTRSDDDSVVRRADNYYVRGEKLFRRYKSLMDLEVLTAKEGKDMAKMAHATNGHLGADLTWKELERTVTWSSMRKDIRNVCGGCEECRKYGPKMRQALVHVVQRFGPFDAVAFDHLNMPKTTEGCGHLLVAIDIFTKFIWAWKVDGNPCQASTIACINDLAAGYMLPKEIISDNARTIMGDEVQKVFGEHNVPFTQCAPYATDK